MSKTKPSLNTIIIIILISIWIAGCSPLSPLDETSQVDSASPRGEEPAPGEDSSIVEESSHPGGESSTTAEDVSIPAEAASLKGLSITDFFDESFKLIMLRNPEWISAEGLDEIFGAPGDQLSGLSPAYLSESQTLHQAVLNLLHTYDRSALTPEDQISYDVYEWYLNDLISQGEFVLYDYPITHFLTGVQNDLLYFFTDLHPLETKQDAENYIARLSQIDEKYDGLIESLDMRAEAGVVAPRFIWEWSMGSVSGIANNSARFTPFYMAFSEKVASLSDASDAEKSALLEAAEEAIAESVIPAYKDLAAAMRQMMSVAPSDDGVWQFERGEEYYAYTLHHHSTSDMTAEEIHELGLKELDRIHDEMYAAFRELGYSTDGVSIAELFDKVELDGGKVPGNEVGETFENLAAEAEANLGAAFDVMPEAPLTIIAGDIGDFYISPSLDGSRPGAFYAQVTGSGQDYYAMPSLAYHEGIPGHHFQIAIAQEADLPLFRNAIHFTGYAEGWALYAERLASELGWYVDDPYGNLGRLQFEAFRAARLAADTGIHAQGWTYDEALEFMSENVGYNTGDNVNLQFEISRYIAWPGQATSYMVGMLKILELREDASEQLGQHFELKEFHNAVLVNGSMPLDVLEKVIDNYIADKLEQVKANEAATLSSLEQVDDYPLYTMHYSGAYLSETASDESASWIGNASSTSSPPAWACSLVSVHLLPYKLSCLCDSEGL